jgi:hypothetical protein
MKSIKIFIAERGLTVMLCGMGIILTGVIASMIFKQYEALYAGTIFPKIAIAVVFVGVVIYFIGRVSHEKQRRRRARSKTLANSEDDND